jgi:vacuolar-type H+-ATPase subunit H
MNNEFVQLILETEKDADLLLQNAQTDANKTAFSNHAKIEDMKTKHLQSEKQRILSAQNSFVSKQNAKKLDSLKVFSSNLDVMEKSARKQFSTATKILLKEIENGDC